MRINLALHCSIIPPTFSLTMCSCYNSYTVYCTVMYMHAVHITCILSGVCTWAYHCFNHFLSEKIVQSLSENLKALALHLLSAGLITVSILEKTNELNETKREKATRLYTALLGGVKHYPQKYHEFVSTLRLNPLHTDLVKELDKSTKSCM